MLHTLKLLKGGFKMLVIHSFAGHAGGLEGPMSGGDKDDTPPKSKTWDEEFANMAGDIVEFLGDKFKDMTSGQKHAAISAATGQLPAAAKMLVMDANIQAKQVHEEAKAGLTTERAMVLKESTGMSTDVFKFIEDNKDSLRIENGKVYHTYKIDGKIYANLFTIANPENEGKITKLGTGDEPMARSRGAAQTLQQWMNTSIALRKKEIGVNKTETVAVSKDPRDVVAQASVSEKQLNEQFETTNQKLDSLNVMLTRGAEVTKAIEDYVVGGGRRQLFSDRGGVYGWIRTAIGANKFDKYLDKLDAIKDVDKQNVNDAIDSVLGKNKKRRSAQLKKDVVVLLASVGLSGGDAIAVPLGHVFGRFKSKLANLGVDLETANNLAAYIEGGAKDKFDPKKEYVSDHGTDSLSATQQLKSMLIGAGLSDKEIDDTLAGKVTETSGKIRTVIQSFLQNIVGRDVDAITKGSFRGREKIRYIGGRKWDAIPGNPEIKIPRSQLGGDPKYGAARKVAKAIAKEIDAMGDNNVASVLAKVDTRMEGITYLLGLQVSNDRQFTRGKGKTRGENITSATNALNSKIDNVAAMDLAFFERYPKMPKEALRRFSALSKFDSIDSVVNNFPTTPYVAGKLKGLDVDSSADDYKKAFSDKEVAEYLDALTGDNFVAYRRSKLKEDTGLNDIREKITSKNAHGLAVTEESTGAQVLKEMKNNTVDGAHSVLTTIEETLIDNGILTISSADLEQAISNNWEVVRLKDLRGAVRNTGRGRGQANDTLTSFKKLAKKDDFLFKTQIDKTLTYLDTDGNNVEVDYKYSIYFRPECKNPIIHSEIVKANGKRVKSGTFDTSVPSLIPTTIPLVAYLRRSQVSQERASTEIDGGQVSNDPDIGETVADSTIETAGDSAADAVVEPISTDNDLGI